MSDPLAAGIHALAVPGLAHGFAAVIDAHRFLHNDRITVPDLIQPPHQLASPWRSSAADVWGLLIHDWSALCYPGQSRKADQTRLNNRKSRGYELTSLLLLDGRNGDPIAPLELRLRTAHEVFSTRQPAPATTAYRIDEVLPSMQAVAGLGLGGPLVPVIDREADALAQYRDWQAAGHAFLVRAKGSRKVRWQGQELSLAAVASRLSLQRCRQVRYRGQAAVPHVAQTEVVLARPAWRHRRRGQQLVNERLPGAALTLRLIVSRVCDSNGRTLAVWYLLTNLPATVGPATVALWYYGRWRIESLFKRLKSAGHQVEHWQQQGGAALARRLLVALMACALVWQIQREPSPAGARLRTVLGQLSGRQQRRGQEPTASALLAGLGVLLAMLEVVKDHSVEELRHFKKLVLDAAEDSG